MTQKHYTETDFLNRLYEIGREDGHLDECIACREQYAEWLAARKQVTREPEVPPGLLMEQRRRILDRAGQPLGSFRNFLRWSPALAMVAMALFAILWKAPGPGPATVDSSDAQVMADIYKTAYDIEPQAVAPLHGLFEDKGQAND